MLRLGTSGTVTIVLALIARNADSPVRLGCTGYHPIINLFPLDTSFLL